MKMKYVKRFLQYLRINDEQDNLSLTNILIYVMAYKFATTETNPVDMAALMTVVLNYFGKKWLGK